jgi:hypothetical protein
MPTEEGIGLNHQERLFPAVSGPREQDQEYPISFAAGWALYLTTEDDQLLTEQGIFGDEVRLGAGQIVQRSNEESAARWFRPPQDTLMDPTEHALESALERSEHSSHSSIGSFKKMGEVRDAGKLLWHGFYRDDQRNGKQVFK